MDDHRAANQAAPRLRRAGSRDAIVDAAERLFLERGFASVSMDDLAEAAGVARRTLYNQFASKEEIFREMLPRVSEQLEGVLPPGIETRGDVEDVLRLIAHAILALHAQQKYLGFFRMVVAESRQFPWIAEAFAAVMEPQIERLARYFSHLTAVGILACRNALLAAHQFAGILNEFFLWPWMMGRQGTPVPAEEVIEEAIRMFLQRYRCPQSKQGRRPAQSASSSAFPEVVSVPPDRSVARKQPRRSRRGSA
jgi:TetR/AcrR family transcriptional regulator of autoinduction and epiphytic fitness